MERTLVAAWRDELANSYDKMLTQTSCATIKFYGILSAAIMLCAFSVQTHTIAGRKLCVDAMTTAHR